MIKIDHQTMVKNPAMGFYEIGNQVYWDKASALIGGTASGHKQHDLHWNFNDDVFSKVDWTIEPPGDIRLYYQARARQLREKYDYLILNCSGGSDSTTMLFAFVQAGLHIDEVFVRHAAAGTNKYESNNINVNANNEFSEYEFAAVPMLKWLKKVSPSTKITVHDFSLDIINDTLSWDENFIHWCGDYVTPGCIVRYTHATNKDSLNTFDEGKSVGILFGLDKPKVTIEDGEYCLRFMDRPVHTAIPATVNNGFTNVNVELFYWCPESTAMLAKQCHMIKEWFERPENARHKYMLNRQWQTNPKSRTIYEALIKGIIYPDYDLATFQCNKPTKSLYQEWDYWMNDFSNTAGFKTFVGGLLHLHKNIDGSFLRTFIPEPGTKENKMLNWEYKPCFSNKYVFGTAGVSASEPIIKAVF